MFNFLLTIFVVYYFYKNSVKTGKFRIFLSKLLPTVINALQEISDKVEGRPRKKQYSNKWHGNSSHSYSNQMSTEEARQILGVKNGSNNDEVIKAFKKLMLINHPDKGGSEYIAAKIIQAKDILIKNN